MTMQIPLSQVRATGLDFDAAVQAFVQAKRDHRFTIDEPAPVAAHPLVEAVVRRLPATAPGQPDDFVADYEIIDDTPLSPEAQQAIQVLRETIAGS